MGKILKMIPKPVIIGIKTLVISGIALFIIIEGIIINESMKTPTKEADYLIVLGAKVNGTSPSQILGYRIDKAAEYLKEHPDTKVIVSGGQGADEGISEAEAMYEGLVKRGIDASRIFQETESTSTKENLDFSIQLMEKKGVNLKEENVIIVTTNFHVFRGVKIAEKAGLINVEGLSAKSVWYLVPFHYVREFLAIIKNVVLGNM